MIPLQWINSVSLSVYTPEHITSQVREDVWRTPGSVRYVPEGDGWYAYRTQYAVFKRNSLFLRGYEYRIELQKARDEKEWEEKCRVSQQAMCFDQETQDRWVFNDFTTYLERWPEGGKAGEYFESLMTTQPYDCESLREHLTRGDLSPLECESWRQGARRFSCLRSV